MTLQLPTREQTVHWYLGASAVLARGGSGNTDLGTAFRSLGRSLTYAPAGIGGECAFYRLELSLFRDNPAAVTLQVIPVIDEQDQDPITLTLDPVATPARELLEVSLVDTYDGNTVVRRGTTWACEIRSSGTQSGRLVVEGTELRFRTLRKGREAVNAS